MKKIEHFNIIIVKTGDSYGLDDILTNTGGQNLVEFWDARWANKNGFGDKGQFVTRYYAETLMGHFGGLILDGGNAKDWSISGDGIADVKAYILADRADDALDDFNYVGSRHHY